MPTPPRPSAPHPADPEPNPYESQPLPAGHAELDPAAVRAYLSALDAEAGRSGATTDPTPPTPLPDRGRGANPADTGFAGAGSAPNSEHRTQNSELTTGEGLAERSPPIPHSAFRIPHSEARLTALGLGSGGGAAWTPTVAGLLLFGRAPQHLLPQAQVKVARFRGDDVTGLIVDRAEIGGAVGPLIEAVTQFVTRNMRVGGVIEGLYRRDVPEYPIQAVREAVTNAIAHRDYRLAGQKVQVRMFDDRLEIESPGGLAGPVTLDTLETRRYSRNPRLAQAMYTLRLVEEMGTGIRRIKRALGALGSGPPTFVSDRAAFLICLPALPLADPADPSDRAPAPTPTKGEELDNSDSPFLRREGGGGVRSSPQSAAWLRAGLSRRRAWPTHTPPDGSPTASIATCTATSATKPPAWIWWIWSNAATYSKSAPTEAPTTFCASSRRSLGVRGQGAEVRRRLSVDGRRSSVIGARGLSVNL